MKQFDFTFKEKGWGFLKRLVKLERKPISEQAADDLIETIQKFFDSGQSTWGVWELPKLRDGKPLVDTGDLRNSWVKYRISRGVYEVASTSPLAAIHEFGAIMTMTEKQRRKLFSLIPKEKFEASLLKGTGIIRIPERAFARPAFDLIEKKYHKYVQSQFDPEKS